jgi:hypothetical protein
MTELFDLIKGNMSDDILDQLGSQVGLNDRKKTEEAATGAFSVLLDAMQRNAQDKKSAEALNNALEKDHDGSIFDDLMGYVSGKTNQPERTVNGAGILKHVLGGKQSGVIDMLGKMTGMDKSSAGNLLIKVAPLVMGALGKQKKTQGLDTGGLFDMLTKTVEPQRQNSPFGGLLNAVLDQDGDGDVKDDLLNMGMKALGGLFKRRR